MKTTKPNRKAQRLKEFDYSTDRAYSVTICTANREHFFGEIKNGEMILNARGEIVCEQWQWLGAQYPFVLLNEFCVMPNHFHGILFIDRGVGTGRVSLRGKIKSLSEIIGAFKTTSSKRIHRETNHPNFSWQRSFYDRIIRNNDELNRICEYIMANPSNWETDQNNLSQKT